MRAVRSHGVQVNRVSDCYGRFIFELPNNEASLLPVTSCLVVKSSDPEALKDANGKPIIRPYTPISPSDAKGELTLLVKKYDSGNASKHIHLLKVRGFSGEYVIVDLWCGIQEGDKLSIKGPIPKWPYKSRFNFDSLGCQSDGTI